MTSEELFFREFTTMMSCRRANFGNVPKFYYRNLPVPKFESILLRKNVHSALVKGLSEKYFSELNNTHVYIYNATVLHKKLYNVNGEPLKSKGKNITREIRVEKGFVAVLSTVSIHLPNIVDGKRYKASEGFAYVDFLKVSGTTYFVYVIPKKNVYRLKLCAMVLTQNKHRIFYQGCRVACQNGKYLYLYVIPLKRYTVNSEFRLICVKAAVNFTQELKSLLDMWQHLGVIFNISITKLLTGVRGENNVAISMYDGSLDLTEYQSTDLNLEQENVVDTEGL